MSDFLIQLEKSHKLTKHLEQLRKVRNKINLSNVYVEKQKVYEKQNYLGKLEIRINLSNV